MLDYPEFGVAMVQHVRARAARADQRVLELESLIARLHAALTPPASSRPIRARSMARRIRLAGPAGSRLNDRKAGTAARRRGAAALPGRHRADSARAAAAGPSGARLAAPARSPISGSTRSGCAGLGVEATAAVTTSVFVMWTVLLAQRRVRDRRHGVREPAPRRGRAARAGVAACEGTAWPSALLGLVGHRARPRSGRARLRLMNATTRRRRHRRAVLSVVLGARRSP